MSDYRVVANVTELPNVIFGHRSLMWWGTLGFIMIEGTHALHLRGHLLLPRRNFGTGPRSTSPARL